MKFCDKIKLILHEFRYDKAEWILSVMLQCVIFVSVLFLWTVSLGLDEICTDYLKPVYEDGYTFAISGFAEEDLPKLEQMGFYDADISEDGEVRMATTDTLDGIWIYKLKAAFEGRDIVNEEIEETLAVMLFCQIILGAVGIIMLIIMVNNLTNSYAMKMLSRKTYINMLSQLGCYQNVIESIYYIFFVIRNIVALIMAFAINAASIAWLNRYISENMKIKASFAQFDMWLVAGMVLSSVFLMWISLRKEWRQMNEN